MKISIFIAGIVLLAVFETSVLAQTNRAKSTPTPKPNNGLGSMSARNAAANSGLAPKPNYNAKNPFAQPVTSQNTARGNIAVQNPSTGRTQVYIPQQTAGGNTVLKNPQTGATNTLQRTATGGQIIRGSNGSQTYIPPKLRRALA